MQPFASFSFFCLSAIPWTLFWFKSTMAFLLIRIWDDVYILVSTILFHKLQCLNLPSILTSFRSVTSISKRFTNRLPNTKVLRLDCRVHKLYLFTFLIGNWKERKIFPDMMYIYYCIYNTWYKSTDIVWLKENSNESVCRTKIN